MISKRVNWIDWMKVIGLYAIILGHYSAPHYKFIYVFSVQLFFILSGYLSKVIPWSRFVKTTADRLAIPLLMLATLYNVLRSVPLIIHGTFDMTELADSLIGCFYGKQESLGPCWFVYTLILCKAVYQVAGLRSGTVIAILCLVFIQFNRDIVMSVTPNCFVNTLLAFPIFMTGVWMNQYRSFVECLNNRPILYAVLCCGIVLVVAAGMLNGYVWMYIADCGGSVLWFMAGGMAGTAVIYVISRLLDNVRSGYLTLIADGSIIVLALHILVVYQSMRLDWTYGYYFLSLVVLIAFIPVIMFCKRYVPILTGYR